MKTLVIVDLQKDFYSKNGSLYVKGSELLPSRITNLIKKGIFDNVILTVDYHPYDHCSFNSEGGMWPIHCVAGSEGASIPSKIFDALYETRTPFYIFEKGNNPKEEEYGAFKDFSKYKNPIKYLFTNDKKNKKIFDVLIESDDIQVAGIAGDYCVLDTIKEMMSFIDREKIWFDLSYIKSIDDGTTLTKFADDNKIYYQQ